MGPDLSIKIKFLIACLFAGFFAFQAKAQNQNVADSLILLLESDNEYSDSALCYITNKIAFNSSSTKTKIHYANKALELATGIDDARQAALSYRHLGNAHKRNGNYDEAIKFYLMAEELYSEIDLNIGIAVVNLDLGDLYTRQENFQNSISYYRIAIDIFRHENDSLRLASTLLNAGELFRKFEKFDSANTYFEESGEIFNALDYTIGTAYNIGNTGLVFAQQGDFDLAEKKMNQAIQILEEFGDKYAIASYQTSLADIYAKKGNTKRGLNYAHNSLEISKAVGLKEQIRDASLILSQLYERNGDFSRAYKYQSQYISYRDSINDEETIKKMADLRTEYEVSKKQAEVDLKQAEVDLLNEQARNNQIVLWSVIVILVLVLGLTYTLLKFYRIKVRAIRIVKKRRKIITAQRNQLAEVNQTKDKFFSIISHDIRGPISNFQGVSQLIQLLVESDDKESLLKLANMLDTSSKEISDLLDNLLEWAMSQQGRMPYKPEEIKLHELCDSNLAIMKNLAAAKKININQKVKGKIVIHADKNSVSTIIRNLVSNAIKFTPEGGRVDLSIGYEVNLAVITVKDTGIGISDEKLQHLFEFKGERSRWGTEGEKGVGLGLTLVNEFVDLNKGKIEVDSIEGKGTTFRVYLPLLSEHTSS